MSRAWQLPARGFVISNVVLVGIKEEGQKVPSCGVPSLDSVLSRNIVKSWGGREEGGREGQRESIGYHIRCITVSGYRTIN